MINMLLPAKRARFIQYHFRIQCFIPGIIDLNTPVFPDTEICTFEHFALSWTEKTEFHIFNCSALKNSDRRFERSHKLSRIITKLIFHYKRLLLSIVIINPASKFVIPAAA